MAPSAASVETESVGLGLNGLNGAVAEQSGNTRHGGENLTPLRAISHGPIIIGGDSLKACQGTSVSGTPEFEKYIWMNSLGKHFGLMTAGDMICLDLNTGAIVGGNKSRPANAAGFLIHSEVHKARPDVHAVCHAHTIAGRAWSAFAKPLDMINQDICNFNNALAVYAEYGGVVLAAEEGKNIAKAMGKTSKGVILMNHGLLTVGSTVDEAGFLFGLLDRGCQIQLQVEAACAGNPALKKQIISDEEAAYNFKMASDPDSLYAEMQADLDYVFETDGWDVVSRGVEDMNID